MSSSSSSSSQQTPLVSRSGVGACEEPSPILRVLDNYRRHSLTAARAMTHQAKSKRKLSSSSSVAATAAVAPATAASTSATAATSSSVSQRLRFDEDVSGLESPSSSPVFSARQAKVSKLSPRVEENDEELASAKQEVDRLKMSLLQKEAAELEWSSRRQALERQAERLELAMQQERLGWQDERERQARDREREREAFEVMKHKYQRNQQREAQRRETEALQRADGHGRGGDDAAYGAHLAEENQALLTELADLKASRDEERQAAVAEREALQHEVQRRQSLLDEAQARADVEARRAESMEEWQGRCMAAERQGDDCRQEIDRLTLELRLNEEATLERQAMRERLAHYPQLVEAHAALKRENQLLTETMDNVSLLRERVSDLQRRLDVAEAERETSRQAVSDAEWARGRVQQWEGACRQLLSEDERSALLAGGQSVTPERLQMKVGVWQRAHLERQEEIQKLQCSLSSSGKRVQQLEETNALLEKDVGGLKKDLEDQGKLIKRFQRKLLLVTKERDSFKGVLESYEHELTFTGGQFEKDRMVAMEKVLKDHQDMIEKLEAELSKLAKSSSSATTLSTVGEECATENLQLTTAKKESARLSALLKEVEEQRDLLQRQLEERIARGDFNPADTRVLHFRQNPTEQAIKSREQDVKLLRDENESLKARVRLLEEGQTQNLTLLVGQKVDEGATSQQVQDLKEQLGLAELRNQRLIEAFKKTSQDFREVCYHLTGYRIDGLANNQYRLSPAYAESPQDHLLFRRIDTGECQLLETPFSGQLTELMELHLKQQQSIPVFLAAVILDLFSRQTFDTMSEVTEATEHTTAAADGADGGGGGGGGHDEEDPICLD